MWAVLYNGLGPVWNKNEEVTASQSALLWASAGMFPLILSLLWLPLPLTSGVSAFQQTHTSDSKELPGSVDQGCIIGLLFPGSWLPLIWILLLFKSYTFYHCDLQYKTECVYIYKACLQLWASVSMGEGQVCGL